MAKFKIGDKVKICEWDYMEKKYGLDPWGAIKVPYSFIGDMKKYCGTVRTIKGVYTGTYGTYYRMKEDEYLLYWSEEMFESQSQNQSIVIYKKDNKVIALDKVTGKTAEAICNPDDKFDFYTGADIAFERLRGRKEAPKAREEAPKYFTGEVICTYTGGYFTKGKIYKIKNGVITRDSGFTDRGLKNVEQLNHLYASKFIEIVK